MQFNSFSSFIFDILQEFRAFELLRSGTDRSEYLLIKEAKIIAMTCTHAALKRRDLVAAGFKVRYFNCSKTNLKVSHVVNGYFKIIFNQL